MHQEMCPNPTKDAKPVRLGQVAVITLEIAAGISPRTKTKFAFLHLQFPRILIVVNTSLRDFPVLLYDIFKYNTHEFIYLITSGCW